jgi:hypothetical protein
MRNATPFAGVSGEVGGLANRVRARQQSVG